MKTYKITVNQQFTCTYAVEAESKEAAWEALMEGQGDCYYQQPEGIQDEFDTAHFEEEEYVPMPDEEESR